SAEEADHVADDRAAVGDHDPGGHGLLPVGRPAPAGSSNPRLRARVRAWARLWAWSLRKRRLWRFSTVFMAMPRVRAVCFPDSPRSMEHRMATSRDVSRSDTPPRPERAAVARDRAWVGPSSVSPRPTASTAQASSRGEASVLTTASTPRSTASRTSSSLRSVSATRTIPPVRWRSASHSSGRGATATTTVVVAPPSVTPDPGPSTLNPSRARTVPGGPTRIVRTVAIGSGGQRRERRRGGGRDAGEGEGEQAPAAGNGHGVGLVLRAELGEDPLLVVLHRLGADPERVGDALGGAAGADAGENLHFPA